MNTYKTAAQSLKELRAEAKVNGLTFKAVNHYYNGNQAYALFNRKTGECVSSSDTLRGWVDNQAHNLVISEYKID